MKLICYGKLTTAKNLIHFIDDAFVVYFYSRLILIFFLFFFQKVLTSQMTSDNFNRLMQLKSHIRYNFLYSSYGNELKKMYNF